MRRPIADGLVGQHLALLLSRLQQVGHLFRGGAWTVSAGVAILASTAAVASAVSRACRLAQLRITSSRAAGLWTQRRVVPTSKGAGAEVAAGADVKPRSPEHGEPEHAAPVLALLNMAELRAMPAHAAVVAGGVAIACWVCTRCLVRRYLCRRRARGP